MSFKKDFELSNISFKYKDGDQEIFKNFNFRIIKGKSVAFLGKSGSGKTTSINIICGLLKPTSGQILVDGKLVNEKMTGWQQNIGLISQENYLLDDTLENNIIFLNSKLSVDKKGLDDAIFYSGVSDFLGELKNGLNTKIGEEDQFYLAVKYKELLLQDFYIETHRYLYLDEFTIP